MVKRHAVNVVSVGSIPTPRAMKNHPQIEGDFNFDWHNFNWHKDINIVSSLKGGTNHATLRQWRRQVHNLYMSHMPQLLRQRRQVLRLWRHTGAEHYLWRGSQPCHPRKGYGKGPGARPKEALKGIYSWRATARRLMEWQQNTRGPIKSNSQSGLFLFTNVEF